MSRDDKTTDDTVPLGWFDGDQYFLTVATDNDEPESWCVVVGRETGPDDPNSNVVRIDTDHGQVHMDRLWLRPDNGRKRYLPATLSLDDAIDKLVANWREYAYRYAREREGRDVPRPD